MRKLRFRKVAAMMLVVASLAMGAPAVVQAEAMTVLAVGDETGALPGDAAVTRVRKALPLVCATASASAMPPVPHEGEQVVYAFFSDVAYTVTVTRVEAVFGDALLVHGTCGAADEVRFSSTLAPDGFLHEVHDFRRGMLYQAAGRADGSLEVREFDDAKRLRMWDEPAVTFSADAESAGPGVTKRTAAAAPAAAAATVIDVMLVFDTTAQTWVNANGGATAFANTAVAKMNTALANSGVDCTYRLVHVMSTGYTYSGTYSTDLNALRAGTGSLSGVAAARNTYGADLVSMMVDTGSAYGSTGLGDMPVNTAGWDMAAFSVCAIRSVNISHTMTHEIGHNLGCGHSKYQANTPGPSKVFTYAAGWYFTGNNSVRYNTIMAYYTDGTYSGYTACDYFSTPLKTFQGVPVGHSADGDNARCISNMKAVIAAYRTAPSASHTVTFDAQGGAVSPSSKTVTQGSTYGTLPTPTRSGYTFAGWYTAANGGGALVTAATAVTSTSNHTLYAKWTAVTSTYTVTFDAQGGSVPVPSSKVVTPGSAYGALATTARVGYVFAGWYTAANGGALVTAATTVTASANHTLYAKWTANNSYTVTFNAQGGTVSPSSKTVTGGGAYGALPTPSRKGYAFGGWYTGTGGSGARVTSSTTVTATASHTLYAAWYTPSNYYTGVAFNEPIPGVYSGLANVKVKGLPTGLKYDAKTQMITGVPTKAGNFAVTITAPGLTSTGTFTVDLLPIWAQGTFNGHIYHDENGYAGGTVTMTVSPVGKVSGKLALNGKTYAFSAPSYARGYGSLCEIDAVVKDGSRLAPLQLSVWPLVIADAVGAAAQTLGVAAGTLDAVGSGEYRVSMYRDVWKEVGAALLEPYVGYYTATLAGNEAFGSGYLTFTVDKAGKVKTAGKLADGTAVSQGNTLVMDRNGNVGTVLYAAPAAYKGGCVYGWVWFLKNWAGQITTRNWGYFKQEDGSLSAWGLPIAWSSYNPLATADYGGGFFRGLALDGGKYDKLGNLYGYYAGKALTAAVDPDVSAPQLAVGATRYDSIWWDPTGIALTPTLKSGVMAGLTAPAAGKPTDADKDGVWDYSPANAAGLKIALTRATGIFKGSFLVWFDYPEKKHVSKSLAFEGALTPERADPGDGVEGRGHFLWADKAVPHLPARPYAFKWSYDFLLRSE